MRKTIRICSLGVKIDEKYQHAPIVQALEKMINLCHQYELEHDVIKSNQFDITLRLKGSRKDIRRMKTQFVLKFGNKFGLTEVYK